MKRQHFLIMSFVMSFVYHVVLCVLALIQLFLLLYISFESDYHYNLQRAHFAPYLCSNVSVLSGYIYNLRSKAQPSKALQEPVWCSPSALSPVRVWMMQRKICLNESEG